MGVGSKKRREHIKGFIEEIDIVSQNDTNQFFNWFDESGGDIEKNFLKGRYEFSIYILMPLLKYINDLHKKKILEIGYGGGRLLLAASSCFSESIGIDIHKNSSIVEAEFLKRGVHNATFIQSDGSTLPLENEEIDVVYSFIVLQHVEKIEIFNAYIAETYRVLKRGGIAILFFGRLYQCSTNKRLKMFYSIDIVLEKLLGRKGYKEIVAQVNCTNLKVSLSYAKKKLIEHGFSVLEVGVSRKLPHIDVFGGQHYIIVKKE